MRLACDGNRKVERRIHSAVSYTAAIHGSSCQPVHGSHSIIKHIFFQCSWDAASPKRTAAPTRGCRGCNSRHISPCAATNAAAVSRASSQFAKPMRGKWSVADVTSARRSCIDGHARNYSPQRCVVHVTTKSRQSSRQPGDNGKPPDKGNDVLRWGGTYFTPAPSEVAAPSVQRCSTAMKLRSRNLRSYFTQSPAVCS